MILASLSPFFRGLSVADKKIAICSVSHFILLDDYRKYRESIKDMSKPAHDLFYRDVKSLIKSSFECRKAWRAVRYSLAKDCTFEEASVKLGADIKGLNLLWKFLSKEDQKLVADEAKNSEQKFLDSALFVALVARLDKYCGRVSYRRLRFLSDNDNSFDLVDLRGDLLAHGLQVVRTYEHTNDINMIENYAKASIQRHAINEIQRLMSESRACVRNTTIGCGTCIFCLSDKPQKCPQAVADYCVTALSLEGVALGSLGMVDCEAEERMSNHQLVSTLREGASPEVAKVVDLVFGADTDDGFESWLLENHKTSVDELAQNPKRLVKLLCHYLDLPTKSVSEHLRNRYSSYKKKVA